MQKHKQHLQVKTAHQGTHSSLYSSVEAVISKNRIVFTILVGILATLAYTNSLNGGLVFDDTVAIKSNPDVHGNTTIMELFQNDFWGTPFASNRSHKSYRPLTTLSFRINFYFEGLESTWGYHVVNVALHAINSMLVVPFVSNLCSSGGDSSLTAFIAAALFATHPIHTEGVASLVGRAETFYTLFCLLGLLAYHHFFIRPSSTTTSHHSANTIKGLLVTIGCVLGATLAKDQAISSGLMLLVIYVAYDICYNVDFLRAPGSIATGIVSILLPARWLKFITSSPDNDLVTPPETSVSTKPTQQGGRNVPTAKPVSASMPSYALKGNTLFARIFKSDAGRSCFRRFLVHVSVFLLAMILRVAIGGRMLLKPPPLDNPLSMYVDKWLQYYLTTFYIHARYAWLLLWPVTLSAEYSYPEISIIQSFVDPRNVFTLVFYYVMFGMIVLALLRRSIAMTISLALLIVPMLPASNLFFPVGTVIGERLLYLPSLGFCILLAMSVQYLCNRLSSSSAASAQFVILSVVALVVALYFARTRERNPDWHDNYSLFHSAAIACPNSAKMQWETAMAMGKKGYEFMDAMPFFERGLALAPVHNHHNWELGTYLYEEGLYQAVNTDHELFKKARRYFDEHFRQQPKSKRVHYSYGLLDYDTRNYTGALYHFTQCQDDYPMCAYNLAVLERMTGKPNYPKMEALTEKCIELGRTVYKPITEDRCQNLLGIARIGQGHPTEGIQTILSIHVSQPYSDFVKENQKYLKSLGENETVQLQRLRAFHAFDTITTEPDRFIPEQAHMYYDRVEIFAYVIKAFAAYSNSLDNEFTFDDMAAVVRNKDVTGANNFTEMWKNDFWGVQFTRNNSNKSYRPLTVLSFRLNYLFEATNSTLGYHLVTVGLHAIDSALVVPFVSNLCGSDSSLTAFIAAALFASHPIHTDAISNTVGRAESFYTFFVLLGLLAFQRYSLFAQSARMQLSGLVLTIVLGVLATLAKDQGLMIMSIYVAYDLVYNVDCFREISNLVHRLTPRAFSSIFCTSSSASMTASAEKSSAVTSVAENDNKTNAQTKSASGGVTTTTTKTKPKKLVTSGKNSGVSNSRYLFWRVNVWTIVRCFCYCGVFAVGGVLRSKYTGAAFITSLATDNPLIFFLNKPFYYYMNALYLHARYAWLLLYPVHLSSEYSYNAIPALLSVLDVRNLATLAFYTGLGALILLALVRRSKSMIIALAILLLPMLPASNLFFPVGTVIGERLLYLPSLGFCILLAMSIQYLCKRLSSSSAASAQFVILSVVALVVALYFARTRARNPDWKNNIVVLERGLEMYPNMAKFQWNMGLEKAAKLGENITTIYDALPYFKRSLEIYPEHPKRHAKLGIMYYQANLKKESKEEFLTHMNYSTDHRHAHCYLGLFAAEEGDITAAYHHYLNCSSQVPVCAYNLAVLELQLDNSVQAEKYLDLAFRFDKQPEYYNLRGVLRAREGKFDEAKELFGLAFSLWKRPRFENNVKEMMKPHPDVGKLQFGIQHRYWGHHLI